VLKHLLQILGERCMEYVPAARPTMEEVLSGGVAARTELLHTCLWFQFSTHLRVSRSCWVGS